MDNSNKAQDVHSTSLIGCKTILEHVNYLKEQWKGDKRVHLHVHPFKLKTHAPMDSVDRKKLKNIKKMKRKLTRDPAKKAEFGALVDNMKLSTYQKRTTEKRYLTLEKSNFDGVWFEMFDGYNMDINKSLQIPGNVQTDKLELTDLLNKPF